MIAQYPDKILNEMSDARVKEAIIEILKAMDKDITLYDDVDWPVRISYKKLYTCYKENHTFLKTWHRKNVVT